jgi:hypothetical protein
MKRTLIACLVALMAVAGTGCGTICNFVGGLIHPDQEPRVYGGVQRDITVVEGLTSKPPAMTFPISNSCHHDAAAAIFVGCCVSMIVVDPALSLAADTLTLPITLYVQHRREAAEDSGSSSPPAPGSTTTVIILGEPQSLAEPKEQGPHWTEQLMKEMPIESEKRSGGQGSHVSSLEKSVGTDASGAEPESDVTVFGPLPERRLGVSGPAADRQGRSPGPEIARPPVRGDGP